MKDKESEKHMNASDFYTGIQHVGIPTNDIEETIRFYESLGFEMVYRTNNAGEEVAFLRARDLMIETYQNGQATLRVGAIDHIAIDVKDIDTLFAWMRERGYALLDERVNSLPFWERGIRYFTISGPNREKIEFCERL